MQIEILYFDQKECDHMKMASTRITIINIHQTYLPLLCWQVPGKEPFVVYLNVGIFIFFEEQTGTTALLKLHLIMFLFMVFPNLSWSESWKF